jgi:hypothetical protein
MATDYIDKTIRDLRNALKSLSDQSLKTSRRLDDTYYSILEKVSVLRQTIGSLQELSGLTKELRENFESDTKELIDDVQGQFDSFENFDSQQQQIVVLEERIRAGKEKADMLVGRLAKAKERVDARAQSESEWQSKNTSTSFTGVDAIRPLTILPRKDAHLLEHNRLYYRLHLCLDPLSPIQTSPRRSRSEANPRLYFKRADHGSANTRHSEGSHHRPFNKLLRARSCAYKRCTQFGRQRQSIAHI